MATFAKYLEKLQDLTQKNLDILNLLNNSLYSRAEHVSAKINGVQYSIPSYLYIENKLNDLEGNWKRLIVAPEVGEAGFIFDGNTRRILVEGFANSPAVVSPVRDDNFYVENNDIFKDFISPLVYLKYNLHSLPDSINKVNVRKIAAINPALIEVMAGISDISWSDFSAILSAYTKDKDYVLYDKIYDLPIKISDYSGQFTAIEAEPEVDTNSTYYDFTFDGLSYYYDNGTLTRLLQPGDYLITEDNTCKLLVESVDYNTFKVRARLASGYKRIYPDDVIKIYYNQEDFSSKKYIKVPLEEDKYIAIFIAAVNDTINIQSTWSDGQVINVDNLTDAAGNSFRSVYNDKIRNIGDILYDLTKFNNTSLSNLSEANLKALFDYKPIIAEDTYDVILLNEHLLDNASVESLRKLNAQKAQINNELLVLQDNIDKINSTLATTDFTVQDTSTRRDLENTLEDYNKQKETYVNSLNSIVNQITLNSTTSSIPTSKSKYVIEGGVDYKAIEDHFKDTSRAKVIRIELLYRYKNINRDTSNATTVNDIITVSDWNRYNIDYRQKVAVYEDNQINYIFEEDNDDSTTGRWSTYQIPITQGETVDMRYRVQYDLGYPYVCSFSDWSDIVNIEFPDDLIQNTDVADILEANDKDSKIVAVKKQLLDSGISSHADDKIIDQNQVYYHKPENISSGFYTDDSRRIISLKDKLYELNNTINELKSGAFGSTYNDLIVYVSNDEGYTILQPNEDVFDINIPNYSSLEKSTLGENIRVANVVITITNKNNNYPINIYSMYPGDKNTPLSDGAKKSRWYGVADQYSGVKMYVKSKAVTFSDQRLNQLIYFRSKDQFTNTNKYTYSSDVPNSGINIIPLVLDMTNIQVDSAVPGSYMQLNPSEAITIPIQILVKLTPNETAKATASFDIWISPFQDPLTYTFNINAGYQSGDVTTTINKFRNNPYIATFTQPTELSRRNSSTSSSHKTSKTLEATRKITI